MCVGILANTINNAEINCRIVTRKNDFLLNQQWPNKNKIYFKNCKTDLK